MMKYLKFLIVLTSFLFMSFQKIGADDVVPDKATAIKVAEALWLPLYGKAIYNEQPFKAKLYGDTLWEIVSTPHLSKKERREEEEYKKLGPDMVHVSFRGVYVLRVKKADCKVLYIGRSK